MSTNLEKLNIQAKVCKYCSLHKTRTNVVTGEGKVPSKLMFIAQAPGKIEDQSGRMLIGPSGKVFDELLFKISLSRQDVYLTNLVKCYLPKCRKPRHIEMVTCYNRFLYHEIEFVKPEIIIPLGFHVTRFIFELYNFPVSDKYEIKNRFGKLFIVKNIKILPLKHPSTVVHKSKTIYDLLIDYNKIVILLKKCPLYDKCETPKLYNRGLIQNDIIEQFCNGLWIDCNKFKQMSAN